VVTTLFFMWGALTSLNDVLIPHFQHVFQFEAGGQHAGTDRILLVILRVFHSFGKGHRLAGLSKGNGGGAAHDGHWGFLFVPAAKVPSFGLFLTALIVLQRELLSCRLRPIRMSRFWGQPGPLPVG